MPTFKVAVTGGICSGKTFVLDVFKKNNISTFSFDESVHWCLKNNKDVLLKIYDTFPDAISKTGVNTLALRKAVFNSASLLSELESILYPHLFEMELSFFNENLAQTMVVSEVPLLFEKNLIARYDYIILTTCAQDIKIARAAKRHVDKETLLKIQSVQISDEDKIYRSDLILDTSSSRLEKKNELLIKELINRFVV